MKNKNMLTSFALTLIALSVIGFTYAGWRDRVFIEGTAHMGELIVGILVDPLPDNWDVPVKIVETTNGYPENGTGAPSTGPGSFIPKPWVANTTVFLDDFRTSVHHDPVETVAHYMKFYINNSYPQYDAHIRFFIKNAGTIPAHVRFILFNVTVEGVTDPLRYLEIANETWVYDPVNECWNGEGYVYDPVEDTYPIRWHIRFYVPMSPDPLAIQLEPCHRYLVVCGFEFTQEAMECHTYRFSSMVDAIQWNKDYEWGP